MAVSALIFVAVYFLTGASLSVFNIPYLLLSSLLFIISTLSYHLVSGFTRIDIVSEIALVLIFGLLADMMNTWMLNTGILRRYVIPTLSGRGGRRR